MWMSLHIPEMPPGGYPARRREFIFAMLAGYMNVLPQLLRVEPVALTFGKIYLYYGTQRVFCEADEVTAPNTAPAFRLFHNIWFEGEQMDTWVAHADFVRHPEFKDFYPEASDRRRLNHLNQ